MIIEAVGRRGIHRWRNKWTGEEAFAPIRGRGGERRDISWRRREALHHRDRSFEERRGASVPDREADGRMGAA